MTESDKTEARRIIETLLATGWTKERISSRFRDGVDGVSGNEFMHLVAEVEGGIGGKIGGDRGNAGGNQGIGGKGGKRGNPFNPKDLDDFLDFFDGEFQLFQLYNELGLVDGAEKRMARDRLKYLVKTGVLERTDKAGRFRKIGGIEEDEIMDLTGEIEEGVYIHLPCGLGDVANIPQGGVIIVAGTRNAGKTAFLLNVAADNRDDWNVTFMNSESSEDQLKKRLRDFEELEYDSVSREEFTSKVKFIKRSSDFHDRVKSGENNLYVIDYMQLYDEHYKMAGLINKIYQKMDGKGVAVIGLQLPENRDYATGGEATLDVACLYLLIKNNELTLRKIKDFKGHRSPQGLSMPFKLYRGVAFYPQGSWPVQEVDDFEPPERGDDIPWK